MKEEDVAIAKALALFHDVGRFEQLRGFGSFNDSLTVDHALLGLKVINSSGVLSILPKKERNLIRKSIWHHNKYQIPVTEKAEVTLFSKLIRDADKLDILGIVTQHFETRDQHPNQALDFGQTDELGLTEEVVAARVMRVSEEPQAIAESVPMLQGMTTMAWKRCEPLANGAAKSRGV
jgi:hypothetical protein